MKFFIYAYPGIYGGLHGMYNWDVVECNSIEEAQQIGLEQAMEIFDSYDLDDEYYSRIDYLTDHSLDHWDDSYEDDYYDILENCKVNDCEYEIYELKPNVDVNEVLHCNLDPRSIIKKYCVTD